MPQTLHIEGSEGEGGGQVLRSALALSMSLGIPFTITNIRANRDKPGLMRQHLTAVDAATTICGGTVIGAAAGSRELTFTPGRVRPGSYHFQIGTAGSTTLVLQAILPALMFADGPSEIILEGGTHTRWAPPFEFLDRALVPLLNKMGANITCQLERIGFYPAGGGRIGVSVKPATAPKPLHLERRGEVVARRAKIILGRLPLPIGEREAQTIRDGLGWDVTKSDIRPINDVSCAGNAVVLEVQSESVTEVFSALGEPGLDADAVAGEAIKQARDYLASTAPAGPYMADQLMVPLALAAAKGAGQSAFVTHDFTRHAMTNHEVVGRFLGTPPRIDAAETGGRWSVG